MQKQIEAMADEYRQTICMLQDRLANMRIQYVTLQEQNTLLVKQVEELKPKE